MPVREAPPFPRGQTFLNGDTAPSDDPTPGKNLEGMIVEFTDANTRGGVPVVARIVRNNSGLTLVPPALVKYDTAWLNRRINGYNSVEAGPCVALDDQLSRTTGVPNNDLCYVILRGPVLVRTPAAGIAASQGDRLVGITAAASTSPDAGAADLQSVSLVAATSLTLSTALANSIQNSIGKAMSAMTSGQTNADFLIMAAIQF